MTQAYILFGLRLLSAFLLLVFLAGIAWLAYQDLRLSAQLAKQEQRSHGYLKVVEDENGELASGTLFPLFPVTTIGRAQGSTIMLDDDYVSTEHAMLTIRANQLWLEDLNSRNGTLLNELPLTESVVLSSGDIISIGGTHFKVEPNSNEEKSQIEDIESANDSS